MNVDRARFLKLAVAIATATSTTAACSATPEDQEAGGGAQANTQGLACTITQPGRGSMAPFAYAEGFCFDLAVHEVDRSELTPADEGVTTRFFDFVYDQCRMYSAMLQPEVAKSVHRCLESANQARGRNADGVATEEFDAGKMYDCGKEALWGVCSSGIDGRINAQKDASGLGRCDRIAAKLKTPGTYRPASTSTPEALVDECNRVLSGLKTPARVAIEACVQNEGWDLYTCVEGLSVDFAGKAAEEPAPAEAEACLSPSQLAAPAASECEKVIDKMRGEDFMVEAFARSHCEMYRTKLSPAAAASAVSCLLDPSKQAYDNIYTCGQLGLKRVCKDDAVDAKCAQIVSAITAVDPDANKGGRITRQCRSLMPGLRSGAQNEVAACVPSLASSFGRSLARFAFYSCIEGLDP